MNDDSFTPLKVMDINIVNITSAKLEVFLHVSLQEVIMTIMKSPTKSCEHDPTPTELIKDNIETISPLIQMIANKSFSEGIFPDDLKEALLRPLLKKPDLELVDLNYHPVLNLTFLSKSLERLAAKRIIEHVQLMMEHHQLAYLEDHSTETLLLRVKMDIMKAIDKGEFVCLVLLDLSATFDNVDHKVLLQRLEQDYSITDTAIKWIHSHLSVRRQRVAIGDLGIDGVTADLVTLTYGVPKGVICRRHGIEYELFADDTWVYLTFKLLRNTIQPQLEYTGALGGCIKDITTWMTTSMLKLNDGET